MQVRAVSGVTDDNGLPVSGTQGAKGAGRGSAQCNRRIHEMPLHEVDTCHEGRRVVHTVNERHSLFVGSFLPLRRQLFNFLIFCQVIQTVIIVSFLTFNDIFNINLTFFK